MTMLTAGRAHAHLDPPADPPLLTEQDINTLTFLSDVDDGTNGLAELRLIYTVQWGGGHGATIFLWSQDHNFDTIAPPYSPIPPNLVIGTHLECTPAATPVVMVQAVESDQGLDPFLDLLVAVGGGAVGGVLGSFAPGPGTAAGAGAGVALASGLVALAADYFDSDDPLILGADFNTTGNFSTVALPDGPCSGLGFHDTSQKAYCSAAQRSSDSALAGRYREYARFGVDDQFPFGRSAFYASGRYARLQLALADADVLALEPGGTGDIAATQALVRGAAPSFGRIVAAATIDEAIGMSISSSLISAAQSEVAAGDNDVTTAQYASAVSHYENATTSLLPAMFPDFVNPGDPCLRPVPTTSMGGLLLLAVMILAIGAGAVARFN